MLVVVVVVVVMMMMVQIIHLNIGSACVEVTVVSNSFVY